MYRVRFLLDKDSLLTLYYSLFYPHLTYCCEIWANTTKTKLQVLFIKQKRAIRIINNVGFYDHTNGLFIKCNLLKFEEIVKSKTACIMYKVFNGQIPVRLQSHFQIGNCVGSYST